MKYEIFEVVNKNDENHVVALFFDYHLAERFVESAQNNVYFFALEINKVELTGKELAILTDLLIKVEEDADAD